MSDRQSSGRYIPRLLDDYIAELLLEIPALSIDGPKAVGKTESVSRVARTVLEIDKVQTREYLQNVPDVLESSPKPLLLDEWQYLPDLWNTVRRLVDKGASHGSYILTGSAYPESAAIHSGAGRIIPLRMRPLSLQERGLAEPTLSLGDCLSGKSNTGQEVSGETSVTARDYIREIFRSGFPDIWRSNDRFRKLKIQLYLRMVEEKEINQFDLKIRRPEVLRTWLKAYAAASATTASYSEILDAATPGESDKPSKNTTQKYRSLLENLWLIDDVPMWVAGEAAFGRLKQTPKHFLADPALSAYLLDLDEDLLLAGQENSRFDDKYGTIAGRLFESLIATSLKTYAVVNQAELTYLRTRNGDREIDFIVSSGRDIVAIEVKFAPTVSDSDVAHLNWLHEKYGSRLREKIILTTGAYSYRREKDGVIVLPAVFLGA